MFSFIGYVERAGSGADTITKGWKENNWPKPQIREIYDPDRVEMVLSLHGLEGNMGKDETTQKTGVETRVKTRVKTRDKLLNLLQDTPDISSPDLAEKLGISLKGVEWHLSKLSNEGIIRHIGPRKGGHWEVVK